ncbi:hypothetical protein GCM10027605_40840 [Micromonospora zhanjiangensis]
MYASTGDSESDQAVRNARPRPFSPNRSTRTPGSSSASAVATRYVPSTLALSATVIRNEYGNWSVRYPCNRRTHGSRSTSSLYTGTTTSSIATGAVPGPPGGTAAEPGTPQPSRPLLRS